jgi:Tol biopolymer transport system component
LNHVSQSGWLDSFVSRPGSVMGRAIRYGVLAGPAMLLLLAAGCGDKAAKQSSPPPPRIAFACAQSVGLRQLDICVSDGMKTRRLTQTKSNELGPVWAPDGTKIAFQCQQPAPTFESGFVVSADALAVGGASGFPLSREKGGEICVVGVDGEGARQLTKTDAGSAAPAWSPDGTRIVFARGVVTPVTSVEFNGAQISVLTPGDVHGLFTVDATGGPLHRLTKAGGDDLPAWSPDGQAIAFTTAKGRIAVINASGDERRTLTRPTDAVDVGATWSPDGSSIAFTRYPLVQYQDADTIYTGPGGRETWVMAADGSDQRRLTSTRTLNDTNALVFRPRWSPDGKAIATTIVRATSASYWFQVTVVPLAGGAPHRIGPLASDPDQLGALLPAWSPDGSRISFLSDISGDFDVYTAGANGSAQRPLTRDSTQQYDPAWAPR